MRHPTIHAWYGWYDPRSWAIANGIRREVSPGWSDVRDARTIASRGRRHGRFLATLPRSGLNYLMAQLDAAHALERGEDGDYDYVPGFYISGDPGWVPRGQPLCWPAATASLVRRAAYDGGDQSLPERPVLVSHFPMDRGIVDMVAHPGLPVALVRHPKAAVRSIMRKRSLTELAGNERDATSLAHLFVRWFETWADAVEVDRTGRILVPRYEDLEHDPAAVISSISQHWGLGLGPASIAGAVELCGRDRMAAKTGHDPANVRVSVGAGSTIDPALLAHVDAILEARLHGAFGYDLSTGVDDESLPGDDTDPGDEPGPTGR